MIYDISHKTLIGPKPLQVRFDKIDGFVKMYDGTKYIKLLGPEKYDAIYNRIRYLISLKSSITYMFSHIFAKIKVNSYDPLPIEKRMALRNVIIQIKWVLNKDKNHYHYNIFKKLLFSIS